MITLKIAQSKLRKKGKVLTTERIRQIIKEVGILGIDYYYLNPRLIIIKEQGWKKVLLRLRLQ